MREILVIGGGGCGINIANGFMRNIAPEHGIDPNTGKYSLGEVKLNV